MKITLVLLVSVGLAAPAAAQTRPVSSPSDATPPISLRPFFLAAGQNLTAKESFKAVFGQSFEPFWGGGLELAFRNGIFVDVTASRFTKTGQRAFRFDGQNFGLGIPLTVTETPFEVTGGFRFRVFPRFIPYAEAGVGSYSYKETSQFSVSGEDVDTRHAGYLGVVGAEVRLHRWIGVSVDATYTHVPGILGAGGISKEANENDLGGVAARFRVIVGR